MAYTEKQVQILSQAEALFAEKGYEGTTVRDIADRAGINLAMISYYFGSKEKLLEALFEVRVSASLERVVSIAKNDSLNLRGKIELLIDEYVNKVLSRQDFYKVMVLEQVTNRNSEILKLLKHFKFQYAQLISEMIGQASGSKKNRKNVDVVLLLSTMTGTVMQTLINKDYYREFNNLKKLSAAAFDAHLQKQLTTHLKYIFKTSIGYD